MHRVWNLRTLHRCKKEEYKKKSSITKENQKNFKNIGSKTPFLKDFASTKKIPKAIQRNHAIQVRVATLLYGKLF